MKPKSFLQLPAAIKVSVPMFCLDKMQKFTASLCVIVVLLLLLSSPVLAAGREVAIPDTQFQPINLPHAVTIKQAVEVALRNYPAIAQKEFKLRAAKANVFLAKTQYLPNLNADLQESAVTPNRTASVVMNNVSGFDTVPVDSGPSSKSIVFNPLMNNLEGLNLNWLLVDYGLRRANDKFAYADARLARADVNLTRLDVAYQASDAFLNAVAAKQVIAAKEAELEHMKSAQLRAEALVSAGLRPGEEAAEWNYEVADTKIALIEAKRDTRLLFVELAEKMGVASRDIDVISHPLIRQPATVSKFGPFDLNSHPLALERLAEISRWRAKQVVLDKAYRPHLWLNSSVWGRGSGDNSNPIKPVGGGLLPQVFDYMIGLTYSFPFMEYFPLKAEKQMARNNELAARAGLDLAMQILEKKDAQARILLKHNSQIAEQTPELIEAAKVRETTEYNRYATGLTNMVTLAEAEKALAKAQVRDAIAQVEVWRAILSLAYAQGSLQPFLQLVDIAEGEMPRS